MEYLQRITLIKFDFISARSFPLSDFDLFIPNSTDIFQGKKKKKKPTLKLLHVAILLVIIQNKGKNCKLRLKLQFRIISGSQTKGAQKHFCFTQSSKFGCLLFTLHCSASFLTAVKMVKSRQLKNYF